MAAFPLRAIKDTGKTINITNHFNEDGGGIYALDTGVQQRHPLKWRDDQTDNHAKYGYEVIDAVYRLMLIKPSIQE